MPLLIRWSRVWEYIVFKHSKGDLKLSLRNCLMRPGPSALPDFSPSHPCTVSSHHTVTTGNTLEHIKLSTLICREFLLSRMTHPPRAGHDNLLHGLQDSSMFAPLQFVPPKTLPNRLSSSSPRLPGHLTHTSFPSRDHWTSFSCKSQMVFSAV